MNFSDIKRIGFVVLIGLLILLLAAGFILSSRSPQPPLQGDAR